MTTNRRRNMSEKHPTREIDTLEAHELMYKRRLKEKKLTGGLTLKELVRIANSPETYRRRIRRI